VKPKVYREIGLRLSFVYRLFKWHASDVSLPLGDIIFDQLACRLNDIMFCFVYIRGLNFIKLFMALIFEFS
jgi:hypothetical protein